jgi:acyl-CoA thioester hydrolase
MMQVSDQAQPTANDISTAYLFWTQEKLRNADTDQQGHINNAVVATLFEAGRIDVLAGEPIKAIRAATQIVVARLLIDFKKELFFPGSVRVGTRVPRIGRTSMDFEQTVIAANGQTATALATCVLLDRVTRKPIAVPDAMRAYLQGS